MKAMVLAAGLGTRMREVRSDIPKPLIPVVGRSLLDRALDFAAENGAAETVVNISHLGEQIEVHLRERDFPRVIFSREETPLETGGGIAKALQYLGAEPFLVMNSDTIVLDDMPGSALSRLRGQMQDDVDGVLLLHPREKAIGYAGAGDFFLREDGRFLRRGDAKAAPYVFTGVQLLHPRMFDDAPKGVFSMNRLYDAPLNWRAALHQGEWLHVGDRAGLEAAEHFLRRHIL